MAALRQTGSHCGGPRAGQVLPETQIPPKQSPSCLPVTGRGILRALPGKRLGPGHKGSIFFLGNSVKLAAGSCPRSPYASPTATVVLGLAASCPPCCATPGAAGRWLGRSWKLPAGCGLSSSGIIRRSSAAPGFAFKMLHKRRPGWHPRDKVCPRAEPCQGLCWRSLAPSRAIPPCRDQHNWGHGIPSEGDPTQSPAQALGSGRGPGWC